MTDCFISYSSTDEPFARAVSRDLQAHGLKVFMAGISLEPGQNWSDRIQAALAESTWVVFLASRRACASPYVQQEIGAAVNRKKTLIPVVWDMPPAELPGWANQVQALDIRGQTPEQIQGRILALAQGMKAKKDKGLFLAGALLTGFFLLASRSE
jgi:hypothetical protein